MQKNLLQDWQRGLRRSKLIPVRAVPALFQFLCSLLLFSGAVASRHAAAAPAAAAADPFKIVFKVPELRKPVVPLPESSWFEIQLVLARRGFSGGPIDGVKGAQTVAALKAFQESEGLPVNGEPDDATRQKLILEGEPLERVKITAEDLAALQPISPTWLAKSQQTALAYETPLEMLAERSHASVAFIKRLNTKTDWTAIKAGTTVLVPAVNRAPPAVKAASLHIRLAERALEARDATGKLIAHFPVSIAAKVDKRPVGELHIVVVIPDPNYTFDPAVFPESEEGRELGRKLILPPGPNNPVGVAWIGLDRPGYGIHGTPLPEMVGRTESHGCFRLANWDARTLLQLVSVGMSVIVEP